MLSSGSSVPSVSAAPSPSIRGKAEPPLSATADEAIVLALEALHRQSPKRPWFSSTEIATSLLGQCPQPTGRKAPLANATEATQFCIELLASDKTLRVSRLVCKSNKGRFGLTQSGREGARELLASFEIERRRALTAITATPKIDETEAGIVRQLLEHRAVSQHWQGSALSLEDIKAFYAVDPRAPASKHARNCVRWVKDLLTRAFDAVTMRFHRLNYVGLLRLRLAEATFSGALLPA